MASSTASTNVPTCSDRSRADDVADLGREVVGLEDPGPHRVLEVVADVRDAVGPGHDLALGRGRRRAPPRVVAHAVERLAAEVERRERDVGAVDRVVVAGAGEVRRERLLRRVAGRPVPAVVGERDRLDQRQAQVGRPGDAGGDLRHLDRVGEPGAEMVVFGGDEHLALAGEAPPRPRVLHPVEVALEAEAIRVGLLGRARSPAPTGRVAPGANSTSSAASRSSRDTTPPTDEPVRAPRARAGPPARAGSADSVCSARLSGASSHRAQ